MKDDVIVAEVFWDGLINRIVSDIRVEFIDSKLDDKFRAVWDTGATNSIVLTRTIEEYKLIAFNKVELPFLKDRKFGQYRTNLYLSDEVCFPNFTMTEYDFSWKEDIVIGMDIIKLGKFLIANDKDRTHFAFLLSKETIEQIKKGK